MEINLKSFLDSKLTIVEFFILALINEGEQLDKYIEPDKLVDSLTLNSLVSNLWIKKTEDGWRLRSKAKKYFEQHNPDVNFDEFWDIFPITTPSGRILRASSKVWRNAPTRDYEVCKKKYLSKVKDVESHNKIISIIKARIESKDYEYMNNMETYINQSKWQQDVKYLSIKPQTGKINELS